MSIIIVDVFTKACPCRLSCEYFASVIELFMSAVCMCLYVSIWTDSPSGNTNP